MSPALKTRLSYPLAVSASLLSSGTIFLGIFLLNCCLSLKASGIASQKIWIPATSLFHHGFDSAVSVSHKDFVGHVDEYAVLYHANDGS